MLKKHIISVFCGISLICLVFQPVIGQEGSYPPPPEKREEQTQISDNKLDKAIDAYLEISQIDKYLQKSMQKAESQEDRQQMQHNANSMMVKAVEDAGLTAEEYNTIMQQVNANEETSIKFRKKVQNQIKAGKKPEKQK